VDKMTLQPASTSSGPFFSGLCAPGPKPACPRTALSLALLAGLLAAAACGDDGDDDADGFVRVAAGLASDRARLALLRAGLRQRLAASPLLDADAYAARFHAALRSAWRDHCAAGRA